MDTFGTSFLAHHLARLISGRFNVDQVLVATVLSAVFAGKMYEQTSMVQFFGLVIAAAMIYYGYSFACHRRYNILRLYDSHDWLPITYYMERKRHVFRQGYSCSKGHPFQPYSDAYSPMELEKIEFHEQDLDGGYIDGYVQSSFLEQDQGRVKGKKIHKYVDLCILKGQIHPKDYYDTLCKYRKDEMNRERKLKLYFQQVYGVHSERDVHSRSQEYIMYEGAKEDAELRYKMVMQTYYGPERDWIWKHCHEIQNRPETFRKIGQEARLNMLFYGPPGTGKSSLAYRLAVALGRHLISIDMKTIVQHCHKFEVYPLFYKPCIESPTDSDKSIILIEELDIVIRFLLEKKRTNEQSSADALAKKTTPVTFNHFEVEDLLEIFQGPMPVPGSIIIATTNRFEEIQHACPALVRTGRLTPVRIDYMDWRTLQEMCQHCFGQHIEVDFVPETKLTPSEVMEYVQICLLDGGFDKFKTFITSKMKIDRSP